MSTKREPLDQKHGFIGHLGCDVPDPWYDSIDNLLTELKKLPVWHERCIHQIKDKFDQLRVYADLDVENDPVAKQLILEAERKCSLINPYPRPPRGTTSYP